MNYHRTGFIPSNAYDNFSNANGISWLGSKSEYPILHSRKQFEDMVIEFRQEGTKNKYVREDENGDIIRDKNGLAVYMSNEEINENGLPFYDTLIVAFDGDMPIGFASDEFGTDGIWVIEDYQGLEIGTYLLKSLREQFKPERRIGQMTNAGYNMSISLHREYIKDALEKGLYVPEEVLNDYPELKNQAQER